MTTMKTMKTLSTMAVALSMLTMAACSTEPAAQRSALLRGEVLDLAAPAGVSVGVVGSGPAVQTDDSGQFQLAIPAEDNVRLRFSRSRDGISAELELEHGLFGHRNIKVRLKGNKAEAVQIKQERLNEFEGALAAVDQAAMKLTLVGGQVISLDSKTVFDPTGDLFSLASAAAALQQSASVRVEGSLNLGSSVAAIIKIEVDENGMANGNDAGVVSSNEFEGALAAVDQAAMKLTLVGGQVISLDGKTVFDPTGDLFSLASAAAALQQGASVRVEGTLSMGSSVATSVKIEVDGNETETEQHKNKGGKS